MGMYKKLCEAMDSIINTMDIAMENDNDTILTESQIDDQISESVDKYFEDIDMMFEKWSDEQREQFMEHIDDMLENEPELMEERNIVRFDQKTVFSQLVGLFSLVIARRRKDPAFALYKKGSAIRRKAKNTIRAKYANRAVPIARSYLKRKKRKF